MSVMPLGEAVGRSQSALSQHLAKLREGNIVGSRRAGQTIFYRLADSSANRILKTLKSIYC